MNNLCSDIKPKLVAEECNPQVRNLIKEIKLYDDLTVIAITFDGREIDLGKIDSVQKLIHKDKVKTSLGIEILINKDS